MKRLKENSFQMDSYQVKFTKSAEKDLRRIDTLYLPKIMEVVESLSFEPHPHGSKKLAGSEFTYRVRVGSYRIIYEIEGGRLVILIVRIRHRKDVYKR